MYSMTYLLDQQDALAKTTITGDKRITPSVVTPTISYGIDDYFDLRMYLRPDLHKEIYPDVPIPVFIPTVRSQEEQKPFVYKQENDPYFFLRQGIEGIQVTASI